MSLVRTRTALLVALTVAALGVGVAVVVTAGSGPDRVAASPAPAAAATAVPNTVSVSGTGSVEGVPNTLVATLRVHVHESSVQGALNDSATDARDVITSLRSHGVAAADIRTADVSLDPAYNDHGEIVGYDSSESLSIHIQPLSNVGRVLSAASTSAGNAVSVEGLSFDIAHNASLLAAARASAFANAKAAASQYAELSGASLGRVARITSVVTGASPVTKDVTYGLASRAATAAIPIEAGQQKVSVTVKVIWALA
jgi:uncharacterized protein YggE